MSASDLVIGGRAISPGTREMVEVPLVQLYTHSPMTMPVHVVRGKRDGPRLFVSAAVHGDELNGIEIIGRLLKRKALKRLRGTLIGVPMVNVYGVVHQSRYLPDRRDLNRSFPGSERGSLTSRLAHLFMNEIVKQSTHGLDLHTGAVHRTNLPQVRANLDHAETNELAKAFGVPVLINANIRDGSLRQAAEEYGIPMLLYEAGEALRFDEVAIKAGLQGVLNVMRHLGMLPPLRRSRTGATPFVARSSAWVRSPESGVLRSRASLGARVDVGDVLGVVTDPFGNKETAVETPFAGIVVGKTNLPLVHAGEALYHVARFEDVGEVAEHVEAFQALHDDSLLDN